MELSSDNSLNNYKVFAVLLFIIGIVFLGMSIVIHLGLVIETSSGYLSLNKTLETPYLLMGVTSLVCSTIGFLTGLNNQKGLGKLTIKHESKPATNTTRKPALAYMLFAIGALLLVVGIYLITYSTVQMVDSGYSIFGVSIPVGTQVYPFQGIGIISAIAAFVLIGIAFLRSKN
jgi:hypothetical protein